MNELYTSTISSIRLSGPTNFAPLLNQFATLVQSQLQVQKYHILLILTDGAITDMMETKDAIVQLSGLPVSIIIVGVGNADFRKMEELDGDDGVLRSRSGEVAKRDIV